MTRVSGVAWGSHQRPEYLKVLTFLILRWRLVIHGGIDGFLRMIVFYNAAQVTWQVLYSIVFSKQLEVFVYLQEYGLIRVVRMLHVIWLYAESSIKET